MILGAAGRRCGSTPVVICTLALCTPPSSLLPPRFKRLWFWNSTLSSEHATSLLFFPLFWRRRLAFAVFLGLVTLHGNCTLTATRIRPFNHVTRWDDLTDASTLCLLCSHHLHRRALAFAGGVCVATFFSALVLLSAWWEPKITEKKNPNQLMTFHTDARRLRDLAHFRGETIGTKRELMSAL